MQPEISKCYFSHNFYCSPSKLYDNTGYHMVNLNACNTANEKLASSTLNKTLYSQISKHSCILGIQFQQSVKAPGPLFFFFNTLGLQYVKTV